MNNLTFFEHQPQPFDWRTAWNDSHYTALEQVRRATKAEVLHPEMVRGQAVLRASHFVGVVYLHDTLIQILPKVYYSPAANTTQQEQEATANLLHMLTYAANLPVLDYELAPLLADENNWFEVLTRLFATNLLTEWQRRSYRSYTAVEDELPVLRGKLRLTDQLRHPARQHIFSLTYDEFTLDNPLNRVLRAAVERLLLFSRNSANRQLLGQCRETMTGVQVLRLTAADAPPSLINRLNQPFLPLLNLARLFLEGGSLRLCGGDQLAYTFLLNMNKLFEEFIASFISLHRDKILPTDYQIEPQAKGNGLYLAADQHKKRVFQLRPDILFRQGGKVRLLLDTKYKVQRTVKKKHKVSSPDFYQMYAYARRYQCQRVVLLYPQIDTSVSERFSVLDNCGIVIEAHSVNLNIDIGSDNGRKVLAGKLREIIGGEN